MKLMHIADLHLDAKMETGLTPARARERRVELLLTFSRAIDEAVLLGVDAVFRAILKVAELQEKMGCSASLGSAYACALILCKENGDLSLFNRLVVERG